MMKNQEKLFDFCVYIVTSDNVGIGTLIKNTNLMVCCAKSVRNYTKVKFEGLTKNGYLDIVYIDESENIAFCAHQFKNMGYEISSNNDVKIAVGSTQKIQGEPIIVDGVVRGLRSYPIIQNGIEEIIDANRILQALQCFNNAKKPAVIKCGSCGELNDLNEQVKVCEQCGAELNSLFKTHDRLPIYHRIEAIIKKIVVNPVLTRRGDGLWHITNENVLIELSYHQRNGAILAEANLGKVTKTAQNEIIIYLLNQNYHNKELVLSVRNDDIYLCLTLYDHYLDDNSSQKVLSKILNLSRHYQNVLNNFLG